MTTKWYQIEGLITRNSNSPKKNLSFGGKFEFWREIRIFWPNLPLTGHKTVIGVNCVMCWVSKLITGRAEYQFRQKEFKFWREI